MVPDRLPDGGYGFRYYGVPHRFTVGLKLALDWRDQPYGFIGSGLDLTGRMSTRSCHDGACHAGDAPTGLPLQWPYLMVAAAGNCTDGEDLVVRLLLLVTKDFGLLATITLYAGRDREDCCSPEIHYRLEKVPLAAACPLTPPTAADFLHDSQICEWSFVTDLGQGFRMVAPHEAGIAVINERLAAAYQTFLAT